MRMDDLCSELWHLRKPSGINMPRAFRKTIQSILNQHTAQSSVWRDLGAKQDDNLFYSPRGKGSGTWAVYRDRAEEWIRSRRLSQI